METYTDEELTELLKSLRAQLAVNEYNDVHADYMRVKARLESEILAVQGERERRGLLYV